MEPWQWAVAGAGAFMVGLAKTGIAGLGILPVAMFASVLPARESVGVVLIVLIAADVVAVLVFRRHAEWPRLLRLFPWAVVGILVGVATLDRVDDLAVQRMIGAILVVLVGVHLVRKRRALEEAVPVHPWIAPATGLAAGFATMVANAAGPIMVLYLLAMRLPKLAFIGTSAWFFLVINVFKVPFALYLGLVTPASATLSVGLWPVAVAGALSGRWLVERINQRLFEALALFLTLAAGLRLLVG